MAQIGLQLYTIRDELEKDYYGAIRKAKDLGYDGVEFPCGTMKKISASQLKELLEELNIELAGITFEHEEFINNLYEIIAYCKKCGCKSVVYPYIPEGERLNKDGYISVAKVMNEAGRILYENGICFMYHIHGYEFETFGGKVAFDIMINHLNTKYVKLEIDVYWVEHGGVDSVEFTKKYVHLSPTIHFKDFSDRPSMTDTEVGNGCIDMIEIARLGLNSKVEWFVVEQEQFDKPSLVSAKISEVNLRNICRKAKMPKTI